MEANLGYADELWLDDKNDLSLLAYEKCLTLDPNNTHCFLQMARIAQAKGDNTRALAEIGKAIEKDPKDATFLRLRAALELSNKDWIKADVDYRAALELNPDDADALDGIARVEDAKGKNESTIDYCRRALAIRPDFVSAKLLLSVALMEEKRYSEAEELLLTSMLSHPTSPEFAVNLASCYYRLQQPDSAFSVLRRAVTEFPKSGKLLRMLAVEQQNRGAKEEAVRLFAASIAAEPNSIESRTLYTELLVSLKRYPEAADQYRELVKLAPENEKYRAGLESMQKKMRR